MSFFPRLRFRKNATEPTYTEPRIDFVEGDGVTITVTDDPVAEEIHVQFDAEGVDPHNILSAEHPDTDAYDTPQDGDCLKYDSATDMWYAGDCCEGCGGYDGGGGGGGGGSAAILPLDIVPTSPHSKDDEFDGASLNAKWTNPISSGSDLGVSASLAEGILTLESSTAGTSSIGKHLIGIRQDSPSGSFSVSAKLATSREGGTYNSDDIRAGIIIARTANSTASLVGPDDVGARLPASIGISSYSETADSGSFDGYYIQAPVFVVSGWVWVKAVYDSGASSLTFYYSLNGVGWFRLDARTSISQPDRIGLALFSNTAAFGADHRLHVDWFRVTEP